MNRECREFGRSYVLPKISVDFDSNERYSCCFAVQWIMFICHSYRKRYFIRYSNIYSTTEMSSDLSEKLLYVVDFIPNHKYLRLKNGLFCSCDTHHYVQCYSYNSYVELERIACFIVQLILKSFSRLFVYKQKVWLFVIKFYFILFIFQF